MRNTYVQEHLRSFNPVSTKQRIIEESCQKKLQEARQLHKNGKFQQSIEMYHKVIFLQETSQSLAELASIYEKDLLDISTAIMFYRRAHYLKPKGSFQVKEKLKELIKIKGLQLLDMGGCKNILEGLDGQFLEDFRKVYPALHQRMILTYIQSSPKKGQSNQTDSISPLKDHLQSCLAYLQVNHRDFAFGQIENCLLVEKKNVDILILKALLFWSIMQKSNGYKIFWEAYKINPLHPEVALFLRLITPKVEEFYKQAKYDLIQKRIDKCKLKVKQGLEIHPYHTNLLILKAYLHRANEQYETALTDLQLASRTLEDKGLQNQLRSQTSLTYNEMGIYLFKQGKYNQAITLFTEGLSFKPQDWGLYTNRGDCQKALNQYIKALQDYLRAYQFQTKNTDLNFRISSIYSIRGVSLFNSKNYDLAMKEFDQSLKYCPNNQQFISSKVKCLIQLDRKHEAIQIMNNTLKQHPKMNQLQTMLQQVKQPEQQRGPKNRKIIQISKQKD